MGRWSGRAKVKNLAFLVFLGLLLMPLGGSAQSLTPEQIQSVVVTYRPDIRRCLSDSGATLPQQIDMTVYFVINREGETENSRIVESNAGEAIDACVVRVVETFLFPPPPDGVSTPVHYPFIFVTG
jgi:TonB family protein